MIWVLIMATTIYLWWTDEKRKIIEAQWCVATIWGEIHNYLFSTLTSKKLKISNSQKESPNYYIIGLTWWDCLNGCDEINFSYSTWDEPTNIEIYKTLSVSKTCQQTKQPLKFYWSWGNNTEYIVMNKWFSPRSNINKKIFYIEWWWSQTVLWDIIIGLCLNKECSTPKEISKFVVDWRSQTISVRNCKFYQESNPTKCKTREGCSLYASSDPTLCQEY